MHEGPANARDGPDAGGVDLVVENEAIMLIW